MVESSESAGFGSCACSVPRDRALGRAICSILTAFLSFHDTGQREGGIKMCKDIL